MNDIGFGGKGAQQALQETQRLLSANPPPRERAALAGKLLMAAGELGRRQKAVPTPGVEGALRQLQREDLELWLTTFEAAPIKADLARASESAMEAALADAAQERAEYAGWAMEALQSRDRAESALAALERWEALGNQLGAEGKRSRERVQKELSQVDSIRSATARSLAGINDARRAERSKLDPDQRQKAWWFDARAECDGLVELIRDSSAASAKSKAKSAAHCAECERDVRLARNAEAQPIERHITEQELWDLDLGTLAAPRRRWLERHAKHCPECALALSALADDAPDNVIALPVSPSRHELQAASSPAPEVVESRREFKVLLFRGPKAARLVVEPAPGLRVAAASLNSPWAGSLPPDRHEAGIVFDLGPSKHLVGGRKAELTVEVGTQHISLEVDL